jgi:predicted nuclease of predicted toxin-antitoxin system
MFTSYPAVWMKKYDRIEADAQDKNIYSSCFINEQVIIAQDKDVAACMTESFGIVHQT